jgi:hypothetical protein
VPISGIFSDMYKAAMLKDKKIEEFSVGYFRELFMNSKLGVKLENCKSH